MINHWINRDSELPCVNKATAEGSVNIHPVGRQPSGDVQKTLQFGVHQPIQPEFISIFM